MTGGDRHDIRESGHASGNEALLRQCGVPKLPLLSISPSPDGAIFFQSQAVLDSLGHGLDGVDAGHLIWSRAIKRGVVA